MTVLAKLSLNLSHGRKQSFLKHEIDLESPNKNIVPITTTIGDRWEIVSRWMFY